jgi:glycosyltransferase involved in cell wall biosynthesis
LFIGTNPAIFAGFLHKLPSVKILHYLKWMRKRDGGVVSCVMQLAPLQAAAGHDVCVLTADATDVPRTAAWTHALAAEAFAAGRTAACVELALRDRLAEMRGSTASKAERDTPTQLLTRESLSAARTLIGQADVLHLHGPWTTSNLQLASIARDVKTPYVVSAHGMLDDWCMAQGAMKKRLHLALASGRMLNRAKAVHCAAEEEARQVAQRTTAPTRVVALPMDLAPFSAMPGPAMAREKLGLRHETPTLLFLSRLHPKKRAEHAIDALHRLRSQGVDADLILAGPPQDEAYAASLRERVARHQLDRHARFVGMVDGALKISLYQAATALVLPTSQENFGFVLLESLLAGTPVVTTRGVDLWRELEASGGAIVSEPVGSAIAQAVRGVLDPTTRQTMGSRGRLWALSTLQPDVLVAGYDQMYAG